MSKCLFCDNEADSEEHLWPAWILRYQGIALPYVKTIENLVPVSIYVPDVKAKAVCDPCNTGWMSRLETKVGPILKPLIRDISFTLDKRQQEILTRWSAKTGMV